MTSKDSSAKFRERPILFNDEMVRAILDGRKTQTRRVMRSQPPRDAVQITRADWPRYSSVLINSCSERLFPFVARSLKGNYALAYECPYGSVGDRLWVREAFFVQPELWECSHTAQPLHYAADIVHRDEVEDYIKKPSIHMPRWASRITLEITGIRVERLQDISEEDIDAEGLEWESNQDWARAEHISIGGGNVGCSYEKYAFRCLWDRINAKRAPWESNPWVWVIEFKRAA